jgi:hypothetical protein
LNASGRRESNSIFPNKEIDMRSLSIGALAACLIGLVWMAGSPDPARGDSAEKNSAAKIRGAAENTQPSNEKPEAAKRSPEESVRSAVKWLASVQGENGGWGQDGGETSYVRTAQNIETQGNDTANTAVATLALISAGSTPVKGEYRQQVRRGLEFLLRSVEASPSEGLAVTNVTGSQIQRKLGPFIDTFLTSRLLTRLDGETGDAKLDARVRAALEKCVAKIEANQQTDGSWNISGGWAPILGTSMASQSLYAARQKGVDVSETVLVKGDVYAKQVAQAPPPGLETGVAGGAGPGVGPGSGGGIGGGVFRTGTYASFDRGSGGGAGLAESAGVELYRDAHVLEGLSRTDKDRRENAAEIQAVTSKLASASFVEGFGSYGGEEFFSYLNISDSLHRDGGEAWEKWNDSIKTKLVRLQNEEGSWAGAHCITGRVAVTSAAVLTLLVEKDSPEL